MTYIHLFGGLVYLLMGGDLLVRGAVALARRARIPPIVVALTIVAVGTSLPELVVSIQAVRVGFPDIAFGNVVGSNIANILLVAGAPAVVYPLTWASGSAPRDSVVLVAVSLLFALLCLPGALGREIGALLLILLILLVGYALRETLRAQRERTDRDELEWVLGLPSQVPMIVVFLVAGAIGLPIGANMVVDSAVEIADRLQVADSFVGLTIVAVGTSLPELATTVVAAFQRKAEVAVGTVIGSCIFNLLGIMGLTALASPDAVAVPEGFLVLDLPLMLASSLALALLLRRRGSIGRMVGALFLTSYFVYLLLLIQRA